MNIKVKKKLIEIIDINVSSKKKSITGKEIEMLENKYGFILPKDYKDFLCEYGGSFIKDDYLFKPIELTPMTPRDGYDSMGYFYGDDVDDIDTKIGDFHYNFKEKVIPIAGAHGGDLICLGIKGELRGQVFNWYHENEIDDDVNDLRKTLFLVAENFNDFIMSFEYHEWE